MIDRFYPQALSSRVISFLEHKRWTIHDPYTGPKRQLDKQGIKHVDRDTGLPQRFIWFSDVSGTLLERGKKLDPRLEQEVGQNDWLSVYVSGDNADSIFRAIKDGRLLPPDIFAERVSGFVWCRTGESYKKDPKTLTRKDYILDSRYAEKIEKGFNKTTIAPKLNQIMGELHQIGFGDIDFTYRIGTGNPTSDPLRDPSRPTAICVIRNIPRGTGSLAIQHELDFRSALRSLMKRYLPGLKLLEFQNSQKAIDERKIEGLIVKDDKADVMKHIMDSVGATFGLFTGDSSMDPMGIDPRIWTGYAGRKNPDRLLNQALETLHIPTRRLSERKKLRDFLPSERHRYIDRRVHRRIFSQRQGRKMIRFQSVVLMEKTQETGSASVARHLAFINRVRRRYIDMKEHQQELAA